MQRLSVLPQQPEVQADLGTQRTCETGTSTTINVGACSRVQDPAAGRAAAPAGAARVRQRDEEASEVRCAAQTVYSYLA
eukprot:COSAG03_NODE_185_length_10940_cov_3.045383_9_plen_79_part_00